MGLGAAQLFGERTGEAAFRKLMGGADSQEDHEDHEADLQGCSVFSACMAVLDSEFFWGIPTEQFRQEWGLLRRGGACQPGSSLWAVGTEPHPGSSSLVQDAEKIQ